jgi:hypothetical protein
MARQNIDEEWKTDPRRTALLKHVGPRVADGIRVELNWLILSQKGQPVPLKVFKFVEDYQTIIDCGLAEVHGESVVIAGADRYAEFFDKQKENGQKGGRPKVTQKNPKKPKPSQTNPNNPSSSFSSSSSFSKKEEIHNTNTLQAPPAVVEESPVKLFCDEYKNRYNHNPVIGPKEAGILTTFAKNYPAKWPTLIRGYLQMPDTFTIQRSHPVELLGSKLNEIQRFIQTGKVVTRKVVADAEALIDKAQGTHRKPRRPIEEVERERQVMLDEASGKSIKGAS